ncbi:hypothetical protein BRADI_1g45012v3 [Brachypodium distachyon]|uniref:Uncharacterized protein n=1 Tax=Brachypodium distachyon TaxID=15368 RepID=A0A2K2DPF3_BRADI|nr:hypothetical protein BRADI_1g45012v3 [Brachypodium distachyon]
MDQILNIHSRLKTRIIFTPRDKNVVAHQLASKAKKFSGCSPIFSCTNSSHRGAACPLIQLCKHPSLNSFRLTSVLCC